MGRKATTGASFGLNCRQVEAAQMMAHGNDEEEVLRALFLITEDSGRGEKQKARKELHKWMELDGFVECYRSEVKRCMMPAYGRAMQKIVAQMDCNVPWLENKAANDVLTRGSSVLMGEDDKKIVVQVEGMPELGTPDQDE